jgi:hypothetical protein
MSQACHSSEETTSNDRKLGHAQPPRVKEKRTMLPVKRNFEHLHRADLARFSVFAIFAIWVGGFPELAVA